MPNEQVQIVFDSFKLRTDNLPANEALGNWVAYGRSQCVEDWVEILQIYQDRSEELVGRYCSNSAPGPVVSLRKIVVFKLWLENIAVFPFFIAATRHFPVENHIAD